MHALAGFRFVAESPRSNWMAQDLLPAQLVSLSTCICDHFPATWALAWTNADDASRRQKAAKLGIDASRVDDVVDWATARFEKNEIGWPGVFMTLQAARAFADLFPAKNSRLLSGALHEDWVESFLTDEQLGGSEPGVYQAISTRRPHPEPSRVLGWELLGYHMGEFHSWLCHGFEAEVSRALGIRPNAFGFIESIDDAIAAANYCERDDVAHTDWAWAPYQIAEYAL